jgi:2-amino-4-hydroxy-6-hydroxymethyldihydropteridine diphosphokinase
MPDAWIALGGNLGDREASLGAALQEASRFSDIVQVSSFYETEPVGFAEQPPFLNAVARLRTELDPRSLLDHLLAVEHQLGRARTIRNGPRVIDLDLLLYGQSVIDEPGLEIPHPRLHERRFVLAPLAELAPGLIHPVLQQTIAELLAKLPEGEWVRVLHS